MNGSGLDEKDIEILKLIKDNARMSYSEIGEQVSLSRVAVRNRMDAMEEAGVIVGYKTVIQERNASSGIEFLLDIQVTPEYFGEVADDLSKKNYITKLQIASGRCRILAFGFAPDNRALDKYTKEMYYRMRGIKEISYLTLLSTLMDRDGGVEYDKNWNGSREAEHTDRAGH